MNIFVIFALWFVLAEAVLTAVQFILRKKIIKTGARIALIAAKFLLGVVCAVLVLAGPVVLRFAQPFMMALYVALIGDSAADIICTAVCRKTGRERKFGVVKAVSAAAGVLFLVFGVLNMQIVKPAYHTYTSAKLTTEHKFIFVADMHTGSAQPFSVTEKTVADMKAHKPDFVVLGGDITDDYTTKQEMLDTFALFKDFGAPVYYVYGNHDRQGHAEYAGGLKYTREELEEAIEQNGIVILKDSFSMISPDLVLLGREDISEGEGRQDNPFAVNPLPDSYLVVADHQPSDFKAAAAAGADLQVSGHTHAGQLFPLGLFYRAIGYCHGDYEYEGSLLNVSSGACGWRMPLRTDANCNYEVITLSPQ